LQRPFSRFLNHRLGAHHDRAIHHLPIHSDSSARGARCGFQDTAGPGKLLGRRAERRVDRRDLPGVDAKLSTEAQPSRSQRVCSQKLRIVYRGADAVDRRGQSGKAGCHDQLRSVREQLHLIAGDAQVELEIDGPEYEPLDTLRPRDRIHVVESRCRFDHGKDGCSCTDARHAEHLVDAFRLRKHDAGDTGKPCKRQVVLEPRCVRRIDADDHAMTARQPSGH
jgi:hypothetical protein